MAVSTSLPGQIFLEDHGAGLAEQQTVRKRGISMIVNHTRRFLGKTLGFGFVLDESTEILSASKADTKLSGPQRPGSVIPSPNRHCVSSAGLDVFNLT